MTTTPRLCRSGSLSNVVVRPRGGRQKGDEEEDDGNTGASGGGDMEKRKKRTLDNGLELEKKSHRKR